MTSPITHPPVPRAKLPAGENLCQHCTGMCCRYFALPIDTPRSWTDFEFCRWYLLHKGATIFTDDGTWYLCVHADCSALQDDNRCGIYQTRPQICRDYSTADCEYDNPYTYQRYFETADQLWEYAEAVLGPPPGGHLRTPEPPALPILNG